MINVLKIFKTNFIFKKIEKDLLFKNINNNINTRFAPDPNGCLHIGHIKTLLINYIISKKYNGKFNLRFDDTNPINNSYIYTNLIKKDIDWLNIKYNYISYSSDYFNEIYLMAIKLIKKNLAYVDKTPINIYKKLKGNFNILGINNKYRKKNVNYNLKNFLKMKEGKYKENEACLRLKIDMKNSNIIMRDPIIFKIRYNFHYRTKYNWCIYPTYDFSNCICDILENINYSLCTLEFLNNKPLYEWILNSLNIYKKPIQIEFSKLNIEYNILSKKKINILINNNIIKKFNDPRLLTISGMKKRGYTIESIINFFENISITKNNNIIPIKNLENSLKKHLDKISFRIMSIVKNLLLKIINLNKNEYIFVPNNPNNKNLGYRKILFSKFLYIENNDFDYDDNIIGSVFKLRYSYILKIVSIEKKNNCLYKINCKYYKNTINKIYFKNKKILKIVHWVSSIQNFNVNYIIYKKLFNFKNISISKNILNYINKNNILKFNGYIEKSNINFIKKRIYQLERIGYFKINKINFNKSIIYLREIISFNNKFYKN